MKQHQHRALGPLISLADTKLYMSWMSGALLGVGCGTGQGALIFGGAMLTLVVMFGFRRLTEDPLP